MKLQSQTPLPQSLKINQTMILLANGHLNHSYKMREDEKISHNDHQLFMLKSLIWLFLAWGGFALALVGFFYASLVWALAAAAGIFLIYRIIRLGIPLRISRELFLVSIVTALMVATFSLFSVPTVFTGRDQGSFSEAAARLAQNHKLEFTTTASNEFYKLHEPGRALNFPGFYYTSQGKLITQFSLVYIAWLALFFAPFGAIGFVIANGVLFFTFLLSFYLLLRLFLKKSSSQPIILLTATSFVFIWFYKFTLSENMALPLIWLMLLALLLFLKKQRQLYYFVFLIAAILLCFTRIEGIAFLLTSLIVISLNKNARLFVKGNMLARLFLPAAALLIVLVTNVYVDAYFYKEIIKAILPTVTTPQAKYLGDIKNNILPTFYTGKIFYLYGLLGFFIVGGLSTLSLLWKKKFHKLVPFFVILPTFVYFFDSQISPDHPWMLRRFMFSLLPCAIFYAGLLLGKWLEKRRDEKNDYRYSVPAVLIILTLLAMNLPTFLKYTNYTENKSLLTQVQALSRQFSDNDLILIDQQASGDGWSMIAGPMSYLYGKNAVYFFNNHDLAKLDTKAFTNIYLIAPSSQVPLYLSSTIGERLVPVDDYKFSTTRLEIQRNNKFNKILLPEKNDATITGKIFLFKK